MVDLALSNLTSPMVLAFALGAVATLARSDLRLPEAIYQFLSVYLLFAIGLKGGHALAQANPMDVVVPAFAAVAMSVGIAFAVFAVARHVGRLAVLDAASLTAHYGSVSVVTFTAGVMFLDRAGVHYEGYLPLLLALREAPAIVVAFLLAQRATGKTSWRALHEVVAGRSIVLLLGGIVVGVVAGVEADYGKPIEIMAAGAHHVFDCFECAIHRMTPVCEQCGVKIVGHGIESEGHFYCCAACASRSGVTAARDRVEAGSR